LAGDEIEQVVKFLRENSPMAGDTILEMRESMDQATGIMPLPDDVSFEGIDAGGVPAEWTDAPGAQSDRVLLYFHGGGYTIGGIHSHRQLCADLSRAVGLRVLSVDYRLGPEHPYPAAVEDAVVAYRYLLEQGFAPEKIALAGDSAGGGLTAATLVALRDAGDRLPAAGVCLSPWLDLTQSSGTYASKANEDPLVSKETLDLMSAAYLDGQDARQATASPAFAELAGLPPILIQVGTAEVLLDDSRSFARRAKEVGVDLVIEEWQDMIHVWHCFGAMLPTAYEAIDRIGEYLDEKLA